MSNKITWQTIFDDFKHRYPSLGRQAYHYRPSGYLRIHIWFENSRTMEYDYFAKKAKFVNIPFTRL